MLFGVEDVVGFYACLVEWSGESFRKGVVGIPVATLYFFAYFETGEHLVVCHARV